MQKAGLLTGNVGSLSGQSEHDGFSCWQLMWAENRTGNELERLCLQAATSSDGHAVVGQGLVVDKQLRL